MSYSKKVKAGAEPVIVEAERFLVRYAPGPAWIEQAFNDQSLYYAPVHVGEHLMLNGSIRVEPGDWIVKAADGTLSMVKHKIFAASYTELPA